MKSKSEEQIEKALEVTTKIKTMVVPFKIYWWIKKIRECDEYIETSEALNKKLWKLNKFIYLIKLRYGVYKLSAKERKRSQGLGQSKDQGKSNRKSNRR